MKLWPGSVLEATSFFSHCPCFEGIIRTKYLMTKQGIKISFYAGHFVIESEKPQNIFNHHMHCTFFDNQTVNQNAYMVILL